MSVAFYLDVHVPKAVGEQLTRRGIDVLTAVDDKTTELPDDQLLDRATQLGCVMVTFDIRFKALAQQWQQTEREFAGLIYAHPLRVSIGGLVLDLELISGATDRDDWLNTVEHLPL